jgi:hypothetical protein
VKWGRGERKASIAAHLKGKLVSGENWCRFNFPVAQQAGKMNRHQFLTIPHDTNSSRHQFPNSPNFPGRRGSERYATAPPVGAFSETWLRRPMGGKNIPWVDGPGEERHRRAVGQIIPRKVARLQGPPPFRPARLGYRKRQLIHKGRGQDTRGRVRTARRGEAKDSYFLAWTLEST